MKKNKNDQCNQQSVSKSNQPSGGKKREDTKKPSGNPLPNKPEKPDENPDPIKPRPGEDEPEKNDPTRIDEPSPIFNNK